MALLYAQYRRGGFDAVIGNIRRLQAIKAEHGAKWPKLNWQYVIMEHNELDVGRAKALAAELGIPITFKLTWDRSYRPRHIDYLKRETGLEALTREDFEATHGAAYLDIICKNMFLKPQINWDGKLLGCCDAQKAAFGVNVFETGLDVALRSDAFVQAKKCLLTPHPDKETFGDCICFGCPRRKARERFGEVLEL